MGVKERRDRERLGMRNAILDAAREIAALEGWHAVTIRRVAEKIEYSPPTIYEYFPSKEALLTEVAHEGFRLLLTGLQAARDATTGPRERFRAMGTAYWSFVWKYPELYQVISGLGGVNVCEPGHEDLHEEGRQVAELFRDVLQTILPPANRTAEDLEDKVIVLWSLYHGFVALLMAGRIPMEARDRAFELAQQAIGDLLSAWSAERVPAT
jgi:AcrR family transcriptional regulator